MFRFPFAISILALSVLAASGQGFYNDYELEPHRYFEAELKDPMSLLIKRLEAGEITLDEPNGKPLVKRLLEELNIPEESQVLVFTKTSLQRRVVTPKNPRAIYFNEDVYLGWMPNGRIEITSMDPELGGIFYFQRPLDEPDRPLFHREDSCLGCHAGSATDFMPGLLAQSVFPNENGRNLRSIRSFERISHEVPFENRWGGWYVTGKFGAMRHMGNQIAKGSGRNATIDREAGVKVKTLDHLFDPKLHLREGSDLLALMLMDHQISMHHWLMEGHYRVRQGFHDLKLENPTWSDLKDLADDEWADLDASVDTLVRYLLFADEASLGEEPVRGSEAFENVFLANRQTDAQGRSLKDLRLKGHLFQHRCSYMIYSVSFNSLPTPLKREIYRRLHRVLQDGPIEGFEYFEPGEKQAIREILLATKPDLAECWTALAVH